MSTQSLHSCLNQAITVLESFNQTLSQENDLLLTTHDDADLYAFTQQKTEFLAALEQQHEACGLALKTLGLEHSQDGLLAASELDAELAPAVQRFFDLAEQAQQKNNQNGIIIQTYLEHNQQALQAVTSLMQRSEQVYTAQGKTRSHKLLHTPIKA